MKCLLHYLPAGPNPKHPPKSTGKTSVPCATAVMTEKPPTNPGAKPTQKQDSFKINFCPECRLPISAGCSHNCVEALRNSLNTMRIRAETLESELRGQVVMFYRRERSLLLKIADLHEQLEHRQMMECMNGLMNDLNMDEINGQDVSRLDEARAGQIFMQASEPINVKVKRRGSIPNPPQQNTASTGGSGEVQKSRDPTPNSASSSVSRNSQETLALNAPEKGQDGFSVPEGVCASCGRSQSPQVSVAIQTDDVIFMPSSPTTSIWFNEDESLDTERRYVDLIPDISQENLLEGAEDGAEDSRKERAGGTGEEIGAEDLYEEEEEAIYEDLYNDIMPLPAPFNLVEYEDVIIPKTSEKLGMTVCHGNEDIFGVFISSLEPNGVAAKTGSLQIGDQILQINDREIETKEQALNLFTTVKTMDIKVTVARNKQQIYEEILFGDEFASPICGLFPVTEMSSSASASESKGPSNTSTPKLNKPPGAGSSTPPNSQTQTPPKRTSPTKKPASKPGHSGDRRCENDPGPGSVNQGVPKKDDKFSCSSLSLLGSNREPFLDSLSSLDLPLTNKPSNHIPANNQPTHSSHPPKLIQNQQPSDLLPDGASSSNRCTSKPLINKQHQLNSIDRFDSSGYCSSNLNSPKMLHKLSQSPSFASSIPTHGKQYRSYLKLIKLKDEDSVYGVPLGLMPDINNDAKDCTKNRHSTFLVDDLNSRSHSANRRSVAQIRQRAQKVKEETLLLTTDDETISELKIGKFWTKQERKRQFLVAREHKQRRHMMQRSRALYRDMQSRGQIAGSGSSGNEGQENLLTALSKKEIKIKKEKILDNFWTIQELLAHGGRLSDGTLHPLLSVTTV